MLCDPKLAGTGKSHIGAAPFARSEQPPLNTTPLIIVRKSEFEPGILERLTGSHISLQDSFDDH